jgi:hypothetical protein
MKAKERENLVFSWDVSDIVDNEVRYRLENWEAGTWGIESDEPDEEAIRNAVYNSSYFFEDEWQFLIDALNEFLGEHDFLNEPLLATVRNFGWRMQDGFKIFTAKNAKEFLWGLLPNTDCTFFIHFKDGELSIQNYHHDSPTGNEWYYVKRLRPAVEESAKNNFKNVFRLVRKLVYEFSWYCNTESFR